MSKLVTAIAVVTLAVVVSFACHKLLGASGAAEAGGTPATYATGVDEPKANALFHADRGKLACRTGCPFDYVLVATCEDGAQVFAPPGLYVRGRRDTGGYEHRKTDPAPVVVPLSYDWCAP